jgi:hypothetical protein
MLHNEGWDQKLFSKVLGILNLTFFGVFGVVETKSKIII